MGRNLLCVRFLSVLLHCLSLLSHLLFAKRPVCYSLFAEPCQSPPHFTLPPICVNPRLICLSLASLRLCVRFFFVFFCVVFAFLRLFTMSPPARHRRPALLNSWNSCNSSLITFHDPPRRFRTKIANDHCLHIGFHISPFAGGRENCLLKIL